MFLLLKELLPPDGLPARTHPLGRGVFNETPSHQMCIIGGCWYRNAARASNVGVAELVSEHLQLVGREVVIIPQHVVMRRTTGTLVGKNVTRKIINGTKFKRRLTIMNHMGQIYQ